MATIVSRHPGEDSFTSTLQAAIRRNDWSTVQQYFNAPNFSQLPEEEQDTLIERAEEAGIPLKCLPPAEALLDFPAYGPLSSEKMPLQTSDRAPSTDLEQAPSTDFQQELRDAVNRFNARAFSATLALALKEGNHYVTTKRTTSQQRS